MVRSATVRALMMALCTLTSSAVGADAADLSGRVTTPGGLAEQGTLSQPVNIIGQERILSRTKTIVAQVADGEPGVNLQRTSPAWPTSSFVASPATR